MPRIPRPADRITLPRRAHWSDGAACSGQEPEIFFPVGTGGVPAQLETEYAKGFCGVCPVRPQCLSHALTRREDYGVWGGLDEYERAELLRAARRTAEQQRRQAKAKAKREAEADAVA
ncbi:hypothetical protein GCM10010387_16350 [Streptomyces inusitatus]|uniref:Transcriptional regulator WhiB n=1 Tax=Streptomyces inusitatus TaxID=68221 RepID=A0A918PW22_9ACTN|nr:WhiB family transcriptional regulator [Streptomyces inusitatus]GGZ23840.1 hypothetical protein GCM10010387_16350 [Streptomyces inusitatus]